MLETETDQSKKEYRIQIKDKILVVTVDLDQIRKDTEGLETGPCIINMNYREFQRVTWSRMPYEVLPISRYTRHLAYVISRWFGVPSLIEQPECFINYYDDYSEVFINPYDLIIELEKQDKSTDQIVTAVKTFILESYLHEREHANQEASEYPPINWTYKELKFATKCKLALIDLEGVIFNLAFIYIMVDKGFPLPVKIGVAIAPFLTSGVLTSIRDIYFNRYIHEEDRHEIDAQLAISCPLASPVFDFRIEEKI